MKLEKEKNEFVKKLFIFITDYIYLFYSQTNACFQQQLRARFFIRKKTISCLSTHACTKIKKMNYDAWFMISVDFNLDRINQQMKNANHILNGSMDQVCL